MSQGPRATQVEQMQVHKQCQFIMKPRPVEAQHMSAGDVLNINKK